MYLSIFFASIVATAPSESVFILDCKKQGLLAILYLKQQEHWKPENRDKLFLKLKVVSILTPEAAIAHLLPHLCYVDVQYTNSDRTRLPSLQLQYPVYGVLRKYGSAAIPSLMKHLKRPGPVGNDLDTRRELLLSALLLMNYSETPAIGRRLARERIKAELEYLDEHFPDHEFPYLEALLNHQMLK